MGKGEVCILKTHDPYVGVKQAIEMLDHQGLSFRGCRVLVKPNLASAVPPQEGPQVTHPEVVGALIRYLKEEGAHKVFVGDEPSWGLGARFCFETSGIKEVVEREGMSAHSGTPYPLGVLIASRDMVAADIVGTQVMGFDPMEPVTTQLALKDKLGVEDIEGIKLVGAPLTEVRGTMQRPIFRLVHPRGQPGCIVNMATLTGHAFVGIPHTAASRAGEINLSKTLSVEWAPFNIRINCIAIGKVASPGLANHPPQARPSFDHNPMRRLGGVHDIAEAAVYLAGPSGNFITGTVLTVDGGEDVWGEYWALGKPEYFKVQE